MKTFADVAEWCAGAAMQFGDPSAVVCQLFFQWREDLRAAAGDLACGLHGDEVALVLGPDVALPIPLQLGEPEISDEGVITFGTDLIAPGLWAVTPSFNMPGVIHAFVVLYGVPDPAPWEKRIVLPTEAATTCIGCGCSDMRACVAHFGEPCRWLRVDRVAGVGVCNECEDEASRWDRGDRAPQRLVIAT